MGVDMGKCTHIEGYDPIAPRITTRGPDHAVDRHDCGYVDAINALIPLAVSIADERTDSARHDRSSGWWSLEFHAAMDRLANDRGLRRRTD